MRHLIRVAVLTSKPISREHHGHAQSGAPEGLKPPADRHRQTYCRFRDRAPRQSRHNPLEHRDLCQTNLIAGYQDSRKPTHQVNSCKASSHRQTLHQSVDFHRSPRNPRRNPSTNGHRSIGEINGLLRVDFLTGAANSVGVETIREQGRDEGMCCLIATLTSLQVF